MRKMPGNTGRNAGIDLLRGLSIVLVVIHHVALRIPLAKTGLADVLPAPLIRALNWNGQNAVTMFFVISGFLITGTTIRRWSGITRVDPVAFFFRRAARIMPCLIVLVAILSLLDLLHVPDYTIEHKEQTPGRAVLSALTMHLNWYEAQTGYLPGGWDVLWSLSIEEMFYFVFPFACLAAAVFPRLLTVACAVLALSLPLLLRALSDAPDIWQDKAYLPGMSAIAMGVCAALVAERMSPARGRTLRAPVGACGAVSLAFCLADHHALYLALGDCVALLMTVSVAALLLAFDQGWGAGLTGWGTGWLRSFGRMSYEVYLTHMFIVFPVVALFHATGGALQWGWLWFIPVLALSWCLGRLVDRLLSQPADRWLLSRTRASRRAMA